MAISSHAPQPLLLLFLSLFFLPAALGAFVNFTNCFVTNPQRRVNVTGVRVNPYPLLLGGGNAAFTIFANTTFNVRARNIELYTASYPFHLNIVRKNYTLCNVTACPVTPGPIEFVFPIFIPKTDYKLTPQSEYVGVIRMSETAINRIMCVTFRYQIVGWT